MSKHLKEILDWTANNLTLLFTIFQFKKAGHIKFPKRPQIMQN